MGLFGLFGKKETLADLVNDLPSGGLTVNALKALDFIAPGEWENVTDFDAMTRSVTGESDAAFNESVKARAVQLYADKSNGYRKAIQIYERVDSADKALGTAAMADKVGEKIRLLSFLDKLTPAADTTQTVDLALKVISELLAFRQVNGLPGDGIADFAKAIGEYSGEAKIRMAALIAFDGIVPLGPDFLGKTAKAVNDLTAEKLKSNPVFGKIAGFLPDSLGGSQVDFVQRGFGAASGWLGGLAAGLDRDMIIGKLQDFVEFSDDKLDYLGAFLDMATRYYTHTGTQSVATRVLERAVNEV